eukprot:110991-Chlamydomonas_euryale.AAC.1
MGGCWGRGHIVHECIVRRQRRWRGKVHGGNGGVARCVWNLKCDVLVSCAVASATSVVAFVAIITTVTLAGFVESALLPMVARRWRRSAIVVVSLGALLLLVA